MAEAVETFMKNNRSLVRGLAILRSFNETPRPTLTEVAERTELSRATCLRFLRTLSEEGYVAYDDALKRYQLRPLVLELGYAALASLSLPDLAIPELQAVADHTGGAVNLAALEGDEVILLARTIAQAEKRKLVTMNLHVGMRLPAHCTAMGRVLIGASASDPKAFIDNMRIEQVSSKTVVDRQQILEAVERVREHGYAVVVDQLREGYGAVGVPLVIPGYPLFALSASLSTRDNSHERLIDEVLPLLQQSVKRLQRTLHSGAHIDRESEL